MKLTLIDDEYDRVVFERQIKDFDDVVPSILEWSRISGAQKATLAFRIDGYMELETKVRTNVSDLGALFG